MSDIVEKLNDEADRLERRAYGDRCTGPDCALASNVAREAAAEIERLRTRVERWKAVKEIAEGVGNELVREERARLAEAVEVVREFHDAAQIDAVMEGPRLTGWNRSALNRAWPLATAFLAKLEAEVRETALQFLSAESRDEALCARIKALEEGLRQISMACDSYGEDLSFGDMLTVKRIQDQARDLLGGSNE